jgi:hypothetical protein
MGQVSETDDYFRLSKASRVELSTIKTITANKMQKVEINKNNSDQESFKNVKTFQVDELLPSLPLPDLDKTLNKYLESVKPFVNDLEYMRTESLVENFKTGIGFKLNELLKDRARQKRNWVK